MKGDVQIIRGQWHVCVAKGVWRPFDRAVGWKNDYRAGKDFCLDNE